MTQKKKPTQNILNEEQQEMRLNVVDTELKARFWKAQYDIRFYTLEAEKLQVPYDTYVASQREKNQKAYEEFMAQMEKNKEAGLTVEEIPDEQTVQEQIAENE